jgi:uncharacterized repeat protein (TIGR01451 family)
MKNSKQLYINAGETIAVAVAAVIFMCTKPAAAQTWPQISFSQPIGGFTHPTHLASARDGSGRLFVVEQPGRIRIVRNGTLVTTPFLDITARLGNVVGSRGLYSVAFPSDYATKRHFYVNYVVSPPGCDSGCGGSLVIARYHLTADPDVADANSEEIVLTDAVSPGHWGGELAFGPVDGYLYFGQGTGSSGHPDSLGQDLSVLRGKMMRIDVETGNPATYTIPPSNPFVGDPNARPEIWALGLRNPWSSSFDRQTGDFYIADVGSGTREEVDFEPAGSAGGANYGWNIMEGSLCFDPPTGCDTTGLTLPVIEYEHSLGCAISGGSVYRGALYPSFHGLYFFGDWCSGRLWGLQKVNGSWQSALLFDTTLSIIGFGEDESGGLWASDYNGGAIYPIIEGLPSTIDLSVTQNDSADPSLAGSPLTYTIQVDNNSSGRATGVLVTDTMPTDATFISVSSTQGSCTQSGTIVTCRIPSLAAGGSATVTLIVRPTVAGTITNTATVETNEPDSNAADNSATESTTITPNLPALSGLTYNGGMPFVNGTNLIRGTTYTITAQANASTRSVVFRRDGAVVRTDSAAPFNFTFTPTSIGPHTFSATPWSSTGGTGTSGASVTVSFNVVPASSPSPLAPFRRNTADTANTANIIAETISAEADGNSAAANRENTATGAAETGEGVIGAAIGGVAVTGAAAADSSLSAEVIRTTGIGTHIRAGAILTRTTAIILRIGTLTIVAPYQDSDSLGPDPSWVSSAGFSRQSCQPESQRLKATMAL